MLESSFVGHVSDSGEHHVWFVLDEVVRLLIRHPLAVRSLFGSLEVDYESIENLYTHVTYYSRNVRQYVSESFDLVFIWYFVIYCSISLFMLICIFIFNVSLFYISALKHMFQVLCGDEAYRL